MGGDTTPSADRADASHSLGRWPPPYPAPALNFWRRPLSALAVGLIKMYQRTLSRLWPDICIYWPSCSHYAIHAIVKRGLVVGILLGMRRILCCHPFARGGYDPPPGYEEVAAEHRARAKAEDAEA